MGPNDDQRVAITNPKRYLEVYALFTDATSANLAWNEILIVGLFEYNPGSYFLDGLIDSGTPTKVDPHTRTSDPYGEVIFKMFGFVTPTIEACEDFTVKARVPIKRVEEI